MRSPVPAFARTLRLLFATALRAVRQTFQPGYYLNFTLGIPAGDMLQFTGQILELEGGLRETKATR